MIVFYETLGPIFLKLTVSIPSAFYLVRRSSDTPHEIFRKFTKNNFFLDKPSVNADKKG